MSFLSAVIPMNIGGQVCRAKVQAMLRFLISKTFLQRMGAVLDLEQGQFNKLGVTVNLEESATGHCVIDLIQGCADLIADDSARGKTSSSVRRSRNESVKYSETTVETREFSNLTCGSKKVTIIDVEKPRVSLVEVDCKKSCRRWTIGNVVSDNSVFVVKDECHQKSTDVIARALDWTHHHRRKM